jgi:hypothetical protein
VAIVTGRAGALGRPLHEAHSLSRIWKAGPFAAAVPALATASLVDLFTALLTESGCDIEVQVFDPTSGRVKPVHDHELPDDVTALVDTSRARDQSWASAVAGSDLPTFCQRTGGWWSIVGCQLVPSTPHIARWPGSRCSYKADVGGSNPSAPTSRSLG